MIIVIIYKSNCFSKFSQTFHNDLISCCFIVAQKSNHSTSKLMLRSPLYHSSQNHFLSQRLTSSQIFFPILNNKKTNKLCNKHNFIINLIYSASPTTSLIILQKCANYVMVTTIQNFNTNLTRIHNLQFVLFCFCDLYESISVCMGQ